MEFNFDEVFKKYSEIEIEKEREKLEIMKRRTDEYDNEYIISYMTNTSLAISLSVTKKVFDEYHHFLMKKFQELS